MTLAPPGARRPASARWSGRSLWFAGALLYLAFLIATLPATVAARLLARWTDNSVRLHEPAGTFWQGKADAMIIVLGPQQTRRLAAVDWDIVIWRLIKGELAAAIHIDDPNATATATLSYGWNGVRLQDADAALPAGDALLAFWPQFGLWQPGGQLRLATRDFSLNVDDRTAAGEAELIWLNASTSLSTINPLGDYRAAIAASGKQADFRVTTVRGAMQVEGSGAWNQQRGVNFNGTARVDARQQAQLSDFLKLLGKEQSPGVYRLSFAAKP